MGLFILLDFRQKFNGSDDAKKINLDFKVFFEITLNCDNGRIFLKLQ